MQIITKGAQEKLIAKLLCMQDISDGYRNRIDELRQRRLICCGLASSSSSSSSSSGTGVPLNAIMAGIEPVMAGDEFIVAGE